MEQMLDENAFSLSVHYVIYKYVSQNLQKHLTHFAELAQIIHPYLLHSGFSAI